MHKKQMSMEMDDANEAASRLHNIHLSAPGPTSHGVPRRPAGFIMPRPTGSTNEAASQHYNIHLSAPGPTSHGAPRRPAGFTIPRQIGSTNVYSSCSELYAAPDILPNMSDDSWRFLDWSKRNKMIDDLRRFPISTEGVKYLRILVCGPVGAGKSSFINSIDSIFQGRMTSGAIAEAATDSSFTKTLQTHYIKNQKYESFVPFTFCDVMGLEAGYSEGVESEDLINILQGHIRDGYEFSPAKPCSQWDFGYNRNPSLSDRIHCLVSVIPIGSISMMEDEVIDKMKEIRGKAGAQRIPQVAILTKIDEISEKVAEDIKRAYRSEKIKEKMQVCSNRLGVPMNCIFPVKCYHEEIHLNNDVDVLLLSALTNILNFANDHVAEMAAMPPPAANVRGSSSRDHEAMMAAMSPPAADVRGSSSYYVNGDVSVDDNQQEEPPPVPPRTYISHLL